MADIKQAVETASGLLSCFCNILVGFELVYLFVCEPNYVCDHAQLLGWLFRDAQGAAQWSELGGARPLHSSGTSYETGQPPMCMPGQITWKRTGSNAFHAQDTTKHFT